MSDASHRAQGAAGVDHRAQGRENGPVPVPVVAVAGGPRTVLTILALGQAYGLICTIGAWGDYRRPWWVLGVWALLMAKLAFKVWATRRSELVGRVALMLVVLGLVVCDVVVPLASTPEGRLGVQGWNWGVVGLILLSLVAYRPVSEVLALTAVHGVVAAAWCVPAAHLVEQPAAAVVVVIVTAVLPAFSAARFVSAYLVILRERERAVCRRLEVQRSQDAAEAVAVDVQGRLERLRVDVVPLLRKVAEGAPLPLPEDEAAAAGEWARRLREELTKGRGVEWLLMPGGPEEPDARIPVTVVGGALSSPVLRERAGDISALVAVMRRHCDWSAISVTLAPAEDGGLALVVMGRGECARPAHADPAVRAAADLVGGTLWLEDDDVLVVESMLRGPVLPVGRLTGVDA